MKASIFTLVPAAALVLGGFLAAQAVEVDERLPHYKTVEGVSGTIKSVGSDTLLSTMTYWTESFCKLYPNVQPEVDGKGSSTAPPALISGTATFGPMSRAMKAEEIDEFEKKFGYKPTQLSVGIDLLAVYVHKDNPIKSLSLQQCDAIFSKTRRGGFKKDVRTWGDVGLTGDWATRPISLYGRNSSSGTYGYFKDVALFKGDFKDEVKEQPGTSAVLQSVASDRYAIGYSGIGYETADVRAVPLALDAASDALPPTAEHAYSGEYPLQRFLYVYINKSPFEELDPLRREFVRYVFSYEGQKDLAKSGYFPITQEIALEMLALAGIETKAVEAGAKR